MTQVKTVLITGGSSGIGFELSKYFARDAYHLIWVAAYEAELKQAENLLRREFPEVCIDSLAIDLSLRNAAQEVHQWIHQHQWKIDVLVNNAGFGTYGFLGDTSIEKEQVMIHLNVMTVYTLTHLFLKEMKARNSGKILNVSSNTSLQPVPRMATYAASKAFVKHFSESIHEELKQLKSKVTLTVVCPAATKNTKFQQTASMQKVRTFEGLLTTTPEEVAKDAYRGMQIGKKTVLSGKRLRYTHWITRLIPSKIIQFFLRKELEKST